MVAKREPTSLDHYSKIAAIRLIMNEHKEVIKLKKYFYLSSVISYEEGDSAQFDLDSPTIYLVCDSESFYIMGDIEEFNKKMNEFIDSMRKLMDGNNDKS